MVNEPFAAASPVPIWEITVPVVQPCGIDVVIPIGVVLRTEAMGRAPVYVVDIR
jgi:hypothetical protein